MTAPHTPDAGILPRSFVISATCTVLLSLLSLPTRLLSAEPAAYYASSFEPAEGFFPGDAPSGWSFDPNVRVSGDAAADGGQAILLSASSAAAFIAREVEFPPSAGEVFIDFLLRPAVPADPQAGSFIELGVSAIGFRRTIGGIDVLAFDGTQEQTGRWAVVTTSASPDEWLRVTIRHDYERGQWDLFINGAPVQRALGFFGHQTEGRIAIGIFGSEVGDTWLDAIYIGPQRPIGVQLANANSTRTTDSGPSMSSDVTNPPSDLERRAESTILIPPHTSFFPVSTSLTKAREKKLKVRLQVWSVLE